MAVKEGIQQLKNKQLYAHILFSVVVAVVVVNEKGTIEVLQVLEVVVTGGATSAARYSTGVCHTL
jgi:hypothetical protein